MDGRLASEDVSYVGVSAGELLDDGSEGGGGGGDSHGVGEVDHFQWLALTLRLLGVSVGLAWKLVLSLINIDELDHCERLLLKTYKVWRKLMGR